MQWVKSEVTTSLSLCLCLQRVLLLLQVLVASLWAYKEVAEKHRLYCHCALPAAVKTVWVPDLVSRCQCPGDLVRGSGKQKCNKSLGRHTFHLWPSTGTPGHSFCVSVTLSHLHPSWFRRDARTATALGPRPRQHRFPTLV